MDQSPVLPTVVNFCQSTERVRYGLSLNKNPGPKYVLPIFCVKSTGRTYYLARSGFGVERNRKTRIFTFFVKYFL